MPKPVEVKASIESTDSHASMENTARPILCARIDKALP